MTAFAPMPRFNEASAMHPLAAGLPPLPQSLSAPAATLPTGAPTAAPAPAPTPAPSAANALSPSAALNNFASSAGMQFAEQQGANALNNLYAAHGDVQSGAAAKALQSFGQNTALQNYFFPYMNYLQGQQGMDIGAGSSIAGVGTSFGNTAARINQNMGNALSQGALNIGNANAQNAVIGGLANANLASTIGTSLGNLGSSYFAPKY